MKKLLATTLLILLLTSSRAQQDPQYSHYMFVPESFNPAAIGFDYMRVALMGHYQWAGFEGAPKTVFTSYNWNLGDYNSAVGMVANYDQLGFERNTSVALQYAYFLPTGKVNLRFGLSMGMVRKGFFDPTWISISPDPFIPAGDAQSKFRSDAGVWLSDPNNRFYAGLSSTHLTGANFDGLHVNGVQHYWLTGGYKWYPMSGLQLHHSALIKSDLAATAIDLSTIAEYNRQFYGGITYRWRDAIIALVGVKWNQWQFGYSFDKTTSDLWNYSSGTHEILVTYVFNRKPIVGIQDVRHMDTNLWGPGKW